MGLKIHHLNCATFCVKGARLISGTGGIFDDAFLVCHCLLIETDDGLVLVDTGFGVRDMEHPRRLGAGIRKVNTAIPDREQTALWQIRNLGFDPTDVRHIVLTHLDADHGSGIADFPNALVHVYEKEFGAAMEPLTTVEKMRYHKGVWMHRPLWQIHSLCGERWFGFDSVQLLSDRLFDILLVPLHGHTRGHCGVAVATTEGWILHCGDAYFYHDEMRAKRPHCTPVLDALQSVLNVSRAERLYNQRRLRELKKDFGDEIQIFCSHDQSEFEQCLCGAGQHLRMG